MGRGPNVYDKSYVNSGPGVGLSSGSSGSRASAKVSGYSGSSYSSGHSGSGGSIKGLSQAISNAVSTLPAAQAIRNNLVNPATSAIGANAFNSYDANYGLGFDMDEYYDRLLDIQKDNNSWAAAQAQKQMDYQTQSDRYAMAWSAAEANKQRQWTENMSNTAHAREMKDLMSSGLNPILAANNGASSGSGATGQGFSSNGAMANPDTSITGAFASLMSGMISTARDLAVTKMSTDQMKYNSDQQYAAAKLAAGASIYNNNNSVSAQKAISALNRDADIRKASISAEATKSAAAASAGAMMSAARENAAAARYSADQHRAASQYSADKSLESTKYSSSSDFKKDPLGYFESRFKPAVSDLAKSFSNLDNVYAPDLGTWNTMGAE